MNLLKTLLHHGLQPALNDQIDKAFDRLVARAIRKFKGEPAASGDEGELYARAFWSCGYLFFKFVIIGTFRIMVLDDGLKVRFSGNGKEKTVDADQTMIETEFSRTLNKGITEFDILVEEDMMEFIRSDSPTTITVLDPVEKGFFRTRIELRPHVFSLHDPEVVRKMIEK
jgi:hypothetical protein